MPSFWIKGRDDARSFFLFLKLIGLLSLFPLLSAACAPADGGLVFVTVAAAASSTPFQPGQPDSPFEALVTPRVPVESTPDFTLLKEANLTPSPTFSIPDFPLNLIVDINPLTGQPPSDPVLLERRPLAVKVSNYPREIRPQFGLTLADQVFEYYIEWGDTRFIAIFYGNDARQVGPVRSGRFFDEHVTRMYHAFYVFNFADPRELDYFRESDLLNFLVTPGCPQCTCPPFFVFNPNKLADENHLTSYFDTTRFYDCNAKKGVNNSRQAIRNGFFSELIPHSEYELKRIYTYYSTRDYHYWEYDPQTRKYFRFQETVTINREAGVTETYAPLMDALTGQQVNADNVVTLFVSHTFSNKYNAEDEVYNINLINSGKAYVYRDGIVIPALWVRAEVDQPLFLTTLDGNPIFLRPGRTFYEVIGASSTSYQDEDGWYFQFQTP
jgi:hypothetical protein